MHMSVLPVVVLCFVAYAAKTLPEQCDSDGPSTGSHSCLSMDADGEHISLVQKRASTQFVGEAWNSRTQNRGGGLSDEQSLTSLTHFFSLSAPRPVVKIKAYFVNTPESKARASCMNRQLSRVQDNFLQRGVHLEFARWPAVMFNTCTTVEECAVEHPSCFPAGTWTTISHPARSSHDSETQMMRGVIGNWCAHLKMIVNFKEEAADWDYLLAFEDDVILTSDFETSLFKLLDSVPPLWTLVSFDTWADGFQDIDLPEDKLYDSGLQLFGMSGVKGNFWGAQAWMISAPRAWRFAQWYMSLPTMPLDWIPKAPRPMDLGFLAYSPGTALQQRFVAKNVSETLPETCKEESVSDIRKTSQSKLDSLGEKATAVPEDQSKPREVIILGMYNAGTSLMTHLIRENLEKPNKVQLCHDLTADGQCGGVWKHTHPSRISKSHAMLHDLRRNLPELSEAIAVVVVRNPFSLIQSLRNRHHDMDCGDVSEGHDWTRAPCYLHEHPQAKLSTPRLSRSTCHDSNESDEPCWKNVVSAWNSYSYDYLYSIQSLFHKVIFVRYEDIVLDPRPVLEQIAFSANVHMPPKVREVTNGDLRSSALQKLSSEDFMSEYTHNQRHHVCEQLNLQVVYTLGYGACRPVAHKMVQVKGSMDDENQQRQQGDQLQTDQAEQNHHHQQHQNHDN